MSGCHVSFWVLAVNVLFHWFVYVYRWTLRNQVDGRVELLLILYKKNVISHCHKMFCKQECIPVGCILTAAVAASTCSPLWEHTPTQRPTETPLEADPLRRNMVPDRKSRSSWSEWQTLLKYYLPLRSAISETHIATESPGAATITAALVGNNTLVSISGLQREQRDPFRTKLCQFHVVFPENLTTL